MFDKGDEAGRSDGLNNSEETGYCQGSDKVDEFGCNGGGERSTRCVGTETGEEA